MTRAFSPHEDFDSPGFEQLKTYVVEQTGLAYYRNKDRELAYKFSRRMEKIQQTDYRDYLAHLQAEAGRAERELLIQELTIGETYFFRYQEQFDAVRDQLLPELIKGICAERQRLSVWSAGCATGEEIYSLAILLNSAFPQLQSWDVSLLGTDINRDFLRQAEKASYRKWALRNSSDVFLQQYFLKQDQEWQLLPAYRKGVQFRAHNLILDDIAALIPVGGFDLIFCRNVLIYFDQETYRRLIVDFYRALKPGGWLVLGPAELTPLSCEPFAPHALSRLSCFRKEDPAQSAEVAAFSASASSLSAPAFPDPFAVPELPVFPWQSQLAPASSSLPLLLTHSPLTERLISMPVQPSLPSEALNTIRSLADQGQLAAAEALCRQFLAQEPLHVSCHYYLALVLSAQGQTAEALQALKQVLYLDHKHILAHYHQGLLFQQMGQMPAARKAFRNALGLLNTQQEDSSLPDSEEWSVAQLKALLLLQQEEMA
ncbi:MAG: tetratricopeptide repeat protein [Candidatus Sericytochromatia bacterium]|nr:tetratricopeptide repeat protein [Candidatus Sericytochromatia bacterium]